MAEEKNVFDLGTPAVQGDLAQRPSNSARISKKVVGIAFGVVGTIVMVIFASIMSMDNGKGKVQEEKNKPRNEKATAAPEDLKKEDPADDIMGTRKAGSLASGYVMQPPPVAASGVQAGGGTSVPEIDPNSAIPLSAPRIKKRDMNEKTPGEIALEKAETERLRRSQLARDSGLEVKPFHQTQPTGGTANAVQELMKGNEAITATAKALMEGQRGAGVVGGAGGYTPPDGSQGKSDQDEKMKFLGNASNSENRDYHKFQQVSPLSKYELKAGDYIPMTLETGINSDQPGRIIGRSRQGVYDSKTGCHLLIPPMTKFIGKYDSKIALGQERMLFVWNQAIFKDGTELNLDNMQGYDTSGMAGLESEVDNHYTKLMGMAFGMSMLTAATNMALPPPAPGSAQAMSPSQAVGSALVQQYGQLGTQIFGKHLNIQPTLKNYPGERFEIMVPRTIVMNKSWGNRCSAR